MFLVTTLSYVPLKSRCSIKKSDHVRPTCLTAKLVRGNYSVQVYPSFIHHKSLKMVAF